MPAGSLHHQMNVIRQNRPTQQINPEVPSLMHKLIVKPQLAMVVILPRDRVLAPAKKTAAPSEPSHAPPQSHPPQTPQPVAISPFFNATASA